MARSLQLLFILFILCVLGCAAEETVRVPASPAPRPVTIAIDRNPGVIDPLHVEGQAARRLTALVHEGLVVLDDSLAVAPGLASTWKRNKKNIRFELTPGATFASGRPVTAVDVRWSLTRLVDPLHDSPLARGMGRLNGVTRFRSGKADSVSGIVIVDSMTVELQFYNFFGPILELLADQRAAIVPAGSDSGTLDGAGPWRVARADDRSLMLARRPGYHGRMPASDSLAIRVISQPLERRAAFESGVLDLLDVERTDVSTLEARGWTLLSATTYRSRAVMINCKKYPFDAWRVRQALNYGFDGPTLVRGLVGGAGEQSCGPIPPGLPGTQPAASAYRHDPAWAVELLQAAGFARGFHIEILHDESAEAARQVDALRIGLKGIGIQVKSIPVSAGELASRAGAGRSDAVLAESDVPYISTEALLHSLFHSDNFGLDGNAARYESRQVDRALARLADTYALSKRGPIVREIERRIGEAAPWVFLWHPRRYVAVSPMVQGYVARPDPRLERFLSLRRATTVDAVSTAGDDGGV